MVFRLGSARRTHGGGFGEASSERPSDIGSGDETSEAFETSVLAEIDRLFVQAFALVGEGIAGATHALLAGDREASRNDEN